MSYENIPLHMTLKGDTLMLTNPEFTFYGISGEHTILPVSKTDLPSWGPLYNEAVVCTYDEKLVKVYDNGPGYAGIDKSIALEFVSIKPTDTAAIIKFCNKYGMPNSSRQFGNFRNDYLFFNENKDDFSKVIPLVEHRERTWLYGIQRDILHMQLCIKLNQAIEQKHFCEIVDILLYFCFDLYGLDFKETERKTETFQFNHAFYRYAEENGFSQNTGLVLTSIHDLIEGFLSDIDSSYYEAEMLHSCGIPHKDKYVQIYFSMWQHLHQFFTWLINHVTILEISPFAEITYSEPLANLLSSLSETDSEALLKTAKGVFSDIFKENLHSVYPEIVFSKEGTAESTWRIPSLIDAMYLELFFRYTPNSSVRKCENPTCTGFFVYESSRPTKKYCNESCAKLMAKRMERARKRIAK